MHHNHLNCDIPLFYSTILNFLTPHKELFHLRMIYFCYTTTQLEDAIFTVIRIIICPIRYGFICLNYCHFSYYIIPTHHQNHHDHRPILEVSCLFVDDGCSDK